MTIENEELDENALFDQAVSDEPETEVVIEQQEEQPEKVETEGAALEVQVEKPAVDDNAPQVPSWRVREINEERRAAIAERDALKAERDEFRRLVEETRRKPTEPTKEEQAAAKAAKPDPLLDPDGYEKYIEQKLEDKFLNDRRETSLANAHKTYKGEFEEAYSAAQKHIDQHIDPALKARMQQSRDPGETLIQWHREEKAKAEVGTDIPAYKAKLRDELMKDTEFRKAAMAAWREEVPQNPGGRPRVDLPPSLNGASRSNAALRSAMNEDVDDAELFHQTTG